MVAKNELWQISDDEAKKLAQAIKGVLKYHQIPVSPQMLAYLQLFGISVVVYGPRITVTLAAGKMKKEAAKKQKAQAEALGQAETPAMPPANLFNLEPGAMQ